MPIACIDCPRGPKCCRGAEFWNSFYGKKTYAPDPKPSTKKPKGGKKK